MKRAAQPLLLGLAIALWASAPAGATTVSIGAVAPGGSSGACVGCTGFQVQTDAASPSFAVPPGSWMVTSWSIQAGPTATGNARLRIFRPAGVDLYRLVGESTEESVTFGAARSFATSVPVQGGDLLGMRTGAVNGDIASNYPAASPNDQQWQVTGDPMIGQTAGTGGDHPTFFNNTMKRTNIAATLFKADPDGTPPETTLTGGPGKKVAAGKAKFRFESNEAGSTFMCKLDRKPFQPCSSPKKYKVAPGKHKFQVQAADAAANVDGTPAKKKFSVPG